MAEFCQPDQWFITEPRQLKDQLEFLTTSQNFSKVFPFLFKLMSVCLLRGNEIICPPVRTDMGQSDLCHPLASIWGGWGDYKHSTQQANKLTVQMMKTPPLPPMRMNVTTWTPLLLPSCHGLWLGSMRHTVLPLMDNSWHCTLLFCLCWFLLYVKLDKPPPAPLTPVSSQIFLSALAFRESCKITKNMYTVLKHMCIIQIKMFVCSQSGPEGSQWVWIFHFWSNSEIECFLFHFAIV